MSAHMCHAHGCAVRVPPKMLMCRPHWFSLRPDLQRAIWREYRPGQETDKRPSFRYLAVQRWLYMAITRAKSEVLITRPPANLPTRADKERRAQAGGLR